MGHIEFVEDWTLLNLCTEVRFKDHGVKSLEVIDNGSGISKENYEGLGEQ